MVIPPNMRKRLRELAEGRCLPKRMAGIPSTKLDSNRSQVAIDEAGLQGEWAVASLLGVQLDERSLLHGDGGTDLTYRGRRVQVKHNSHPRGDLYFNTLDDFDADIAVLTVPGGENVVRIAGWISREDFRACHHLTDYGYGSRVAVGQSHLRRFDALD